MAISLSDISYFLEVATVRHMTRAADRLGISQPSLTLSVQRLEKSLGASLLIRERRGVSLTNAGTIFVSQARMLMQQWEDVHSSIYKSQSVVMGNYTIGCHPEVAIDSLPLFIPSLLEDFPSLNLRLTHEISRKIVDSVLYCEIDIGLAVNPMRHNELIVKRLQYDEVGLWVGPGDRRIQDPSSGRGILICDPDLTQTELLRRQLRKAGIRINQEIHSTDMEVITSLTASGAGIGILPSEVASRHSRYRLTKLTGAPILRDEVCVVYRKEARKIRAIDTIVKRIVDVHREKYGSV